MSLIFPCNAVSVSLLDPKNNSSIQTYISTSNPHYENHLTYCQINTEEIQQLKDKPETLTFSIDDESPQYLNPLKEKNLRSYLVLPLFIQEELAGIISLGYSEEPALDQEDINQARQLADQVAVALSNAKLIDELNQFNWGTLTALARAIDAKSSWTAGHSENVTKIAIKIGKALGLSSAETEVLRRGGLLHDIGKLGVSHDILDKPGKLNAKEKAMMEKHVLLGARILEPISAYKEIMPIVLEHHENYNGTGYPSGISGEDICLYARIIAVADRFEALTSNRPYRRALDQKSAVEFIRKQTGEEFDPRVAKAFLSVMH
jgi:putative nucleotidyltransferase with HDIG domain